MPARLIEHPHPIAIVAPRADRQWRETEAAAATAAPYWKTVLIDSLGLVLVVWSIPAAILLIGTPIVMAVALVMAFMRWSLQ